ncbi:MAG: protein kinase [Bacteroidales bacterium]|nr:protein kinase [Bacteroidales bacterium]
MADTVDKDSGSLVFPDLHSNKIPSFVNDLQYTAQGSAIDPNVVQYTAQGSAIDPNAVQYTAQGSAIDPNAVGGTPASPQKQLTVPDAGGSEGVLIIQKDGTVLKRYKPGIRCNSELLEKVRSMSGKGYVADLLDYGTDTSGDTPFDFELMRYYPLGSASKFDLRGDAEAVTHIVAKIAICLDACHRNGFIHKDVKPANILITDKKTWDCVLCDFGFAVFLEKDGKVSTIQNRTPIYAAPEVYDPSDTAVIEGVTYCTLTAASDFYSLGMTALSLWKGEKEFNAREAQLAIEKMNDKVVVDKDIPEPLNRIIRGLLVRDPAHRWGYGEIRRTLQEKEVVPVHAGGFEVIFNGQKNQVAHSPEDLARFMLMDQKLARAYLYSGQVSKWLEKRPELKIEIDRIVEKDFPKDELTGMLCALHILNPLYDINVRTPDSTEYAMTGEAIGAVLNEAYNLYYGKFGGNMKRAMKEWDSSCDGLVNGFGIFSRLVSSFESYSDSSYLVWFFRHKGTRFNKQLDFMKYCLDFDSRDNRKKAGPKDAAYLEQTAMMKTISGFGHTPTYDYPDEPAGIRGYLAVSYHENPYADMSKKYAYEKLLAAYLEEYRKHCPDCNEGRRFDRAVSIACDTADKAAQGAGPLVARGLIQRILSLVLAGIPAVILVISAINLVAEYPEIDVSGINFGWTFALIGVALGIVASFVLDSDGCLAPIISGLVFGAILLIIVKLLGTYITWIFAAVILALFIFFLIKVVFVGRAGNVDRMKGEPGFMELTLEPLYFAFNDETAFTSSLSAYVDDEAIEDYKHTLKERRRTLLIFIAIFWALMVGQHYINKATNMPDATESGIQITKKERGIIHEQL